MYDKDFIPQMIMRVLTPNFLENFDRGCNGLNRMHITVKVRFHAAQNGVYLTSNAICRGDTRYVRFACKPPDQNNNGPPQGGDLGFGEEEEFDREDDYDDSKCTFRVSYKSKVDKSHPQERGRGATNIYESYSMTGYFPYHNHEIIY
jgi:hypothetical protein